MNPKRRFENQTKQYSYLQRSKQAQENKINVKVQTPLTGRRILQQIDNQPQNLSINLKQYVDEPTIQNSNFLIQQSRNLKNHAFESPIQTKRQSQKQGVQQNVSPSPSPSPQPSDNFLHKTLQQNEGFVCNIHRDMIKGNVIGQYIFLIYTLDRQKYLKYVCCDPECDTHFLCSLCLQDSLCLHQDTLMIDDFLNQPILAFLKMGKLNQYPDDFDIQSEVVLQQSFLYNVNESMQYKKKVKQEVEYSKNILKEYLHNICSTTLEKAKQIQDQYENNVNNKLNSIRKQIDEIQEICNAYKNHFENITLNIIEESQDDTDILIFKMKQSLQNYLTQSDDPKEQLYASINKIQYNLNSLPKLRTQNLKNTYINMIEKSQFSYEFLIDDKEELQDVDKKNNPHSSTQRQQSSQASEQDSTNSQISLEKTNKKLYY